MPGPTAPSPYDAVRLLEALHGEREAHVVGVLHRRRGCGGHIETLPEERDLLVDDADLEHGTVGDEVGRLLDGDGSALPPRRAISFCLSASNCGWSGWKLRR